MTRISDEWLYPRRPRDTFPPYDLGDRDIVERTEAQTRKLGRIYNKSHDLAWDGPKVLRELIEKHGGVHFPEDKKQAFGRVASVLLWGELAAWSISADLTLKLEDTNAKMAASSQVFDEARHFKTLRQYLFEADIPIMKLSGYSRQLLVMLQETDNLLYKLVGMQLMVENIAVCMFKMLAAAEIEPVLTELLYYFERDEARHVGLGALTLPRILADLTQVEAAKLWWFQLRIQLLTVGGGLTMRKAFAELGVDQAEMQRQGFRLQVELHERMLKEHGDEIRGRGTRGLFNLSKTRQERLNKFLFPASHSESHSSHEGKALSSRLKQAALAGLVRAAERGDSWLTRRAPAT